VPTQPGESRAFLRPEIENMQTLRVRCQDEPGNFVELKLFPNLVEITPRCDLVNLNARKIDAMIAWLNEARSHLPEPAPADVDVIEV
jgi:hypothetical protein